MKTIEMRRGSPDFLSAPNFDKAPVSRRQRKKRKERKESHSDNITKNGISIFVPVTP